jgi:2'-5' RNA ligase
MSPTHNPDTDFGDQLSFTSAANHPPSQMSIQAPEGADIDPSVIEMFDGSINPEAMGAYGAWMGEHLKTIAQISRHAGGILDAALEDLGERDHPRLQGYEHGAGYHFRAYVLSLNIPGVGPKVTSFSWLLLAPELSQLATIDTHMMDVLGYKGGDESPSPRDYFKMERQFRGRLDAAGYQDLPLGLAQWAMWDYKRSGRDTHQDHAGLRPLNFVQHDHIDWNAKQPDAKGAKYHPDPWWRETEGIGDQIGEHFDRYEGEQFRKDEIPFQDDRRYIPITAAAKGNDELHISWPVPEKVRREIADYVATLDWPEDHELEPPEDYHITTAYAPHGYHDKAAKALAKEREDSPAEFEANGLDLFGPEEDTVVIRLDAPEATEIAEKLMNALDDSGLEVSRYEGGYKPHITVGYAKELPKGDDLDLSFTADKLEVSVPRAPEDVRESNIRFTTTTGPTPVLTHPDGRAERGVPGQTIMHYLRNQLGLTTEQAWEYAGAVEKAA